MKTILQNRFLLGGTLALALALMSLVGRTAEHPSRDAMRAFMRAKLTYSQAVLEGMALEKFELISKNAIRLRNMSQSNAWVRIKNPEYTAHTKRYQTNVDALYRAGVDKDLEAATEAYVKVARNCVECHRLVRVEQRRLGELPVESSEFEPERF